MDNLSAQLRNLIRVASIADLLGDYSDADAIYDNLLRMAQVVQNPPATNHPDPMQAMQMQITQLQYMLRQFQMKYQNDMTQLASQMQQFNGGLVNKPNFTPMTMPQTLEADNVEMNVQ